MCNIGFFSLVKKKILKKNAVVGYRFLNISNEGTLHPISMHRHSNLWNKKVAKANKLLSFDNRNGLYIFNLKEEALSESGLHQNRVLVKVKYWGIVIAHETGVRAQFAEIERIYFRYKDFFSYDSGSGCKKVNFIKTFRENVPALRSVTISKFRKNKKKRK